MRGGRLIAVAALSLVGCDVDLPKPYSTDLLDSSAGFPITPRPPCSEAVSGSLNDADSIARVAKGGRQFTCGGVEFPTPLSGAILSDDVVRVRALVEARADPNARWTVRGDRHPLQDAIEAASFGSQALHTAEIVRSLLRHR